MARKPPKETGEVLRGWREAAHLGLDEVAVDARRRMGRRSLSRETIRRYEIGVTDLTEMDPILLAVLSKMYGHVLTDLPENAQEHIQRATEVLMAGGASRSTGWTSGLLLDVA